MIENLPSQEEQDIVRWYVLKRPLSRPNTSYKKVAICIFLFVVSNAVLSVLRYYMLDWLGIFYLMPFTLLHIFHVHPNLFRFLYAVAELIISCFCVSRWAVIGAIRLYQRYAPEDIRRRCLFKPTCSEYAILAVKKYGVIRGLWKSYVRLFKRCRGNIYMLDEP